MGMTSANNLIRVLDNVEGALACELLGALTATDFRRPLKSGEGTQPRTTSRDKRSRRGPKIVRRPPTSKLRAELISSATLVAPP